MTFCIVLLKNADERKQFPNESHYMFLQKAHIPVTVKFLRTFSFGPTPSPATEKMDLPLDYRPHPRLETGKYCSFALIASLK